MDRRISALVPGGGSSGSIPDRNKRPVLISSAGRLQFDNCFH